MENFYGDDFELLLDECESSFFVDFDIFPFDENLEEEKHKISVPRIKIKQEQELCFESQGRSTHIHFKEEPTFDYLKEESKPNLNNLLEEALQLNRELQKDFKGIIYGFKETLQFNLQKQNELEVQIIELRNRVSQTEKTENEKRVNKKPPFTISYFGAPYFKSNLVLEGIPPSKCFIDKLFYLTIKFSLCSKWRCRNCKEIKFQTHYVSVKEAKDD